MYSTNASILGLFVSKKFSYSNYLKIPFYLLDSFVIFILLFYCFRGIPINIL